MAAVFAFLDGHELRTAACVCRGWLQVLNRPCATRSTVWRGALERRLRRTNYFSVLERAAKARGTHSGWGGFFRLYRGVGYREAFYHVRDWPLHVDSGRIRSDPSHAHHIRELKHRDAEALGKLRVPWQRMAYRGSMSGGDRAVRSDVPFPELTESNPEVFLIPYYLSERESSALAHYPTIIQTRKLKRHKNGIGPPPSPPAPLLRNSPSRGPRSPGNTPPPMALGPAERRINAGAGEATVGRGTSVFREQPTPPGQLGQLGRVPSVFLDSVMARLLRQMPRDADGEPPEEIRRALHLLAQLRQRDFSSSDRKVRVLLGKGNDPPLYRRDSGSGSEAAGSAAGSAAGCAAPPRASGPSSTDAKTAPSESSKMDLLGFGSNSPARVARQRRAGGPREAVVAQLPFEVKTRPGFQLFFSTIAYFEVEIEKPGDNPADSDDQDEDGLRGDMKREDCIAIGLANDSFSLIGRQPGWDRGSFGYHGDDGSIFYDSGIGYPFGVKFGPGDTVGCGLNYLTRSIFFTKNGAFLGVAFRNVPPGTYYPIVGVDTRTPFSLNFGGDRPFCFSLQIFQQQQLEYHGLIDATTYPQHPLMRFIDRVFRRPPTASPERESEDAVDGAGEGGGALVGEEHDTVARET